MSNKGPHERPPGGPTCSKAAKNTFVRKLYNQSGIFRSIPFLTPI